jgi:hypothetical protein
MPLRGEARARHCLEVFAYLRLVFVLCRSGGMSATGSQEETNKGIAGSVVVFLLGIGSGVLFTQGYRDIEFGNAKDHMYIFCCCPVCPVLTVF